MGMIIQQTLLLFRLLFFQAQDNIMNLPLANGWGEKHRLYVKWKYIESKVCVFCHLNYFCLVS
jgi:hypothetical protein